MSYNAHIEALQSQLGMDEIDGIEGPKTTGTLLAAARAGRLSVTAMPPRAATVQALPWISALQTVFGLHETRDKASLAAWLRLDGKTLGDPSALPWCGDAVETAIKLSLPREPFPGAVGENPYFARNWAQFGRKVNPSYGAIGVFERGPNAGHVGFLVGQGVTSFFVFGGNQGDSVSVVAIAKTRLLAARWPVTAQSDPDLLPKMDGSKIPKSVNEF